jgi:HTH-type transcriptional regulator / antitoxin HigA
LNAKAQIELRVVKNEGQYRDYLSEIERLALLDPSTDTSDARLLEVLSALVEQYEKERFKAPSVSPTEAILFRIEQQGLQQKDLIPFLGTKSRVSEILSGKRQLTVEMIRKLNEGLGIPAATLIGNYAPPAERVEQSDVEQLPVKELVARGFFQRSEVSRGMDYLAETFFKRLGGLGVGPAYLRWKLHTDSVSVSDVQSLQLWLSLLLIRSRELPVARDTFKAPQDVPAALRELAWISGFSNGPLLAREYLAKKGIALVVEPRLKKIPLDGAALLDFDGTPVIGLTLRFDRLDSFWFTLMHEAAHVFKHLHSKQEAFIDDMKDGVDDERREAEANRLARDAFIPRAMWAKSNALTSRDEKSVIELANEMHISPAIVAGRLRRETGEYRILHKLVGVGEVRKLFSSEPSNNLSW